MRVALVGWVVLAACSDVYYPLRDAYVPDAPFGPVTVSLGVPSPGVRVYFQDRPRDPPSLVTTGSDGRATGNVHAGGLVTVINPYGTANGLEARTFSGLSPGDVLTLAPTPEGVLGGPQIKVQVPSDPTSNGIYQLRAPCGHFGSPPRILADYVELTYTLEGCDAITDLVVWTEVPGPTLHRSISASNVAIVDQAVIDLTSESYVDPTTLTINTSGVPPAMYAGPSAALHTDKGSLYDTIGAPVFVPPATTEIALPGFPGAFARVEMLVYIGSERHILVKDSAPSATLGFSVDASMLSQLEGCPVYSLATGEVTWNESSNGQVADLVAALVVVERASATWTWSVIGPTGHPLMIPALGPSALFDIREGDAIRFGDFYRARVPGGYASVLGSVMPPTSSLYADLRARDGAVLANASGPPAGCL
ncbi:MAG: hypothetical protein H0T46_03600 [Deltaproteobacteria bacterium]|nr:hypothetical protein [Deltaproteobacteria bacterium]